MDLCQLKGMQQVQNIDSSLSWCLLEVCHFWKAALNFDVKRIANLNEPDILALLHQEGLGVIPAPKLFNEKYPSIVQFPSGDYALLQRLESGQLQLQTGRESKWLVSIEEWSTLHLLGSWYIYPLSLIGRKPALSRQLLDYLFKQLATLKFMGIGIVVILVVYELFSLLEPILVNLLILQVDLFSSYINFLVGLIGLGLIFGFALLLGWFRQKLWLWLLGKLSINLSSDLLLQFLYLPRQLMDKTSDAYARFLSLEQMIYRFLQQICFSAFDLLFLAIHLMGMVFFNWKLACLDTLFLALFVGLSYRFTKSYYRESLAAVELQHYYAGYLFDTVRHLSMIQRSGVQAKVYERCEQTKRPYWQAFLHAEYSQGFFEWLLFLLRKINTIGILACGMWLIFNHKITLGGFLGFWTLKQQLFSRLELLMKRVLQWQYFKAPMDKLAEIFSYSEEQSCSSWMSSASDKPLVIEVLSPQIRQIQYPKFSLQWGKHYWLHGPSGCGKTTFLLALMGNLPLTQGSISYPGPRTQDMFAILQNDGLFRANVLDNITLFASGENHQRLWEVIRLVELEEVMQQLPQGLQTLLGEGEYALSAGQVQRVLLARALYRQPKWLILDEATSHLDLATEARLVKSLLSLPCSIIMVNHRHQYAKLFDEQIDLSCAQMCQ